MKMSGFPCVFTESDIESGCLLLMVGNRHLHWGWVGPQSSTLLGWDTGHLQSTLDSEAARQTCVNAWPQTVPPEVGAGLIAVTLPLIYATVVPSQGIRLAPYPRGYAIDLAAIPLQNTYATLGIDRALGVWALGEAYGWPAIVVDGGTALTLSAADAQRQFQGGAILPGLGLQFQSLGQHTAALPQIEDRVQSLPPRWGFSTPDAMLSGVCHSLLAGVRSFLEDWQTHFPDSVLGFTGGDGQWLYSHLTPHLPPQRTVYRSTLVLEGLWQIAQGMNLTARNNGVFSTTIETTFADENHREKGISP